MAKETKVCIICNEKFEAAGREKTCSEECKKENIKKNARKRNHEYMVRIGKFVLQKKVCPVCGEEFETYKTKQLLCGKESCSKQYKNEYWKNYKEENKELINKKRMKRYYENKKSEQNKSHIRYQKSKTKKNNVIIAVCTVCGKLFIRKNKRSKNCSVECKKVHATIYNIKHIEDKRKSKQSELYI